VTTEELTNRLKTYKNVDDFMQEHQADFDEEAFRRFLDDKLQRKGIGITQLAFESGVSVPYTYNIFGGRREPPRKDVLLKLAYGLALSLEETNRLLTLGGVSELRAKIRRESIIIFCLENNHSIDKTDELLLKYGLQALL
jgi:transcriptional regulator with XRE-family HTH domain